MEDMAKKAMYPRKRNSSNGSVGLCAEPRRSEKITDGRSGRELGARMQGNGNQAGVVVQGSGFTCFHP